MILRIQSPHLLTLHFFVIMTKLFKILNSHKIPFAVISGKFDKESYSVESKLFNPDVDLVLNCDKIKMEHLLLNDKNFKIMGDDLIFDIQLNLRIDLYFRSINVGYYHFLVPKSDSYKVQKLKEEDYIIYQLLDPLLKFSKYHKRHIFRLRKYFFDGVPKEIPSKLSKIIGKSLSEELLNKISKSEFSFSSSFIKKCKFRMLFINGNFVKMIKSRVF